MRVALVGYGKMGKQIEIILKKEKSYEKIVRIDKFNKEADFSEVNRDSLKDIDVAIDFSTPESAIDNIKKYVECRVNVVMGTTGWYDKLEDVKTIVGNNIGFIWSGNFSLGVNIFFRIIKESARIINKFSDQYDILSYELHHKEKKDSPSGTAMMIGNILLNGISKKEKIITEKLNRKIENNEIHIASVRGGYIDGTHTVIFDSVADTIELTHRARSREGFAIGAVKACEWIYGKKGFFNIDDFMNDIFK
ncbi:MAG TPA: 4-hydroxy-tetrahydrodipicolinate reductase [Spirochaetota bacterium]|nr:4-hydroxy-tetrahydrodipicolinate reductase [Spirochaetota bacterium]HOL58132.1 4-hydroxy-tetrahydrodipicolinate reductase [Spirochaetota bacterium]HPP05207.1 4-hydroxy-tetrahydrodipicolinate reductase [Spirochaetota bacterium]